MEFLAPQWRELGLAGFGGGKDFEKLAATFVPGYSTQKKLSRGGGPTAQLARMMGTVVERPEFRLNERADEWTKVEDSYKIAGGSFDGNQIVAGFNAHEAYKDLRARADFAAKDLGRDLSEREKAMLLSVIAQKYRTDLTVWSPEDIQSAKNVSVYKEALEEALWGQVTKLKAAASRARREQAQHG